MGLWQAVQTLIERPTIVSTTRKAAWNTGVATSGKPGGDLFTYGIVGQWWRLQEAYILLSAFNIAATVWVRAYLTLMGMEREIMNEDWDVATDPPIIFIIWFWSIEIYGPLRIEVYSDQLADNNLAVPYEYRIKSW